MDGMVAWEQATRTYSQLFLLIKPTQESSALVACTFCSIFRCEWSVEAASSSTFLHQARMKAKNLSGKVSRTFLWGNWYVWRRCGKMICSWTYLQIIQIHSIFFLLARVFFFLQYVTQSISEPFHMKFCSLVLRLSIFSRSASYSPFPKPFSCHPFHLHSFSQPPIFFLHSRSWIAINKCCTLPVEPGLLPA